MLYREIDNLLIVICYTYRKICRSLIEKRKYIERKKLERKKGRDYMKINKLDEEKKNR